MKVLAEVCECAGCVCLTGQDSHFEKKFSGILVTSVVARVVVWRQYSGVRPYLHELHYPALSATC